MPASHTCPACGTDLANEPVRVLPALKVRAVTCPTCGRTAPRPPRRRRRRLALLAMLALALQVVFACGLLLVCTWLLDSAAHAIATIARAGDVGDLFRQRHPQTHRLLIGLWFEDHWSIFLSMLLTGLWLHLGLSHWRQGWGGRKAWLRIPYWGGLQAALLTACWIWPTLEAWWTRSPSIWPDPWSLAAAYALVLIGAPLMAVWLPVETRLLASIRADSLVMELVRRRLRKRKRKKAKVRDA